LPRQLQTAKSEALSSSGVLARDRSYSAFDAWNGTVEWLAPAPAPAGTDDDDGTTAGGAEGGEGATTSSSSRMEATAEVEELYLRARPHLLLDETGRITHLSTGARPTKDSDYVYTLVVPVLP
jgi:hypothetical protein